MENPCPRKNSTILPSLFHGLLVFPVNDNEASHASGTGLVELIANPQFSGLTGLVCGSEIWKRKLPPSDQLPWCFTNWKFVGNLNRSIQQPKAFDCSTVWVPKNMSHIVGEFTISWWIFHSAWMECQMCCPRKLSSELYFLLPPKIPRIFWRVMVSPLNIAIAWGPRFVRPTIEWKKRGGR